MTVNRFEQTNYKPVITTLSGKVWGEYNINYIGKEASTTYDLLQYIYDCL